MLARNRDGLRGVSRKMSEGRAGARLPCVEMRDYHGNAPAQPQSVAILPEVTIPFWLKGVGLLPIIAFPRGVYQAVRGRTMVDQTLGGWLVHVMRQADGALSLEESLHVIMDSMKTYYPCQSVALILIDGDTKELHIKISRQISYTFVKKYHRDGPSPTAERVVLEQEPQLLNGLDRASDTYAQLKLEHDFSSAVLAPVIKNKRGVGYIFCDRSGDEAFTAADLLHLQVVGFLIGSLIEKFELIQTGKKLSQIDDATGTLQYKAFVPALATELERAKSHGYAVSIALVSVAAFRNYIETYGIDAAHGLLAEVAALIKERSREMDFVGRFGADDHFAFELLIGEVTVRVPDHFDEAALARLVRTLRAC